jgi:putative colanic acid biosynthesis UDP-glucose lipid carrier transferase
VGCPGARRSATTRTLASLSVEQKRHVLELTRRVCDANDAYDLPEEQFVLALVIALGLSREEVDDLVLYTAPGLNGVLKRLFDVVFSATFVLLAWPLLLGIGLLVRLTSPGPALFKQKRYGKDGREIRVWKFRTMRVQEDGAVVRQAFDGDPRITPIGRFLRRTSLDELPQFLNVLGGSMSVAGPRPHAVAHNQIYRTQILEYMLRHKVKPGITGWAQVNGWRGQTETLDKMVGRVACDLEYIREQTFWLDLRIVLLTAFGKKVRQNAG